MTCRDLTFKYIFFQCILDFSLMFSPHCVSSEARAVAESFSELSGLPAGLPAEEESLHRYRSTAQANREWTLPANVYTDQRGRGEDQILLTFLFLMYIFHKVPQEITDAKAPFEVTSRYEHIRSMDFMAQDTQLYSENVPKTTSKCYCFQPTPFSEI